MPGRTAVQIKSRWHGKQRGKSGRKPTFLDAYIRNLQDAPAAATSGPHYAETAAEHRADALARARDLLSSGVLADVKPRVPRPLHNRGRPCSSSGWQSGAGTAVGNGGGGAQKRQSTADADEDSADEYTVMGASPRPASALVAAAPAGGSSKKAAAAAARAARQKAAGRRGGRDDGSSDEEWGLASAGPRLSRRRSCSRYEAQSGGVGGVGSADGITFASGSNVVFRSPGGDPTGALTLTPAAAAADDGATGAAEDSGRLGLMRSPSAACETSGYVSAKSGSPLPLDIDDTTFETLLGMAEAEAEALPVLPFASSVTGPPPPPPAAPPRPMQPQPDPQRQQQWQWQGQEAAMAAARDGDGRRAHRGGGGVAPPAGPAYAHSERRVMWLGDFLDPERPIAPPPHHTPAAAAAAAVYRPTRDFARSSSNVGSNTPNAYASSRLSAAAAACNGYAARQRLQQSDWEWEDACDDVDCMEYDCGGSGGFSSANGGGGCGGGHCHGSGGAAGPSALLVEDDEEMGDAILEELFSAVDATGARAEPYPAAAASRVPSSASWRPDGDCLGGRGSGCIAGGSAVDVTGGRRRTVSPVLPASTCISLPYMSKMASPRSYGSRSMCGYAVDGVQASGLGPYLQPTVAPSGAAAAAYQASASATKPSWEMRLPPVHDKHPVQFSPLTPEAEAWGNGVGPCDDAMGLGSTANLWLCSLDPCGARRRHSQRVWGLGCTGTRTVS
ncbi:hypothetical protein HYH03_006770 [Edaphochlamys debaryana]|uniref:HTH myb-type domain-containing protein n=1 Tax=Edaphochlamys debaryana TaxID=47281 RepID=A0A836C129_9CHLO|nr:hypothetical protein HYH03_006770 [Edaphochlamys debaryana]|eukprot:KAG2495163.1 hypothetical protein HYH03_006770 [Edaphochlamys debaryana]